MADNQFKTTVTALLDGMNGFLASKTVVGDPVQVGDTTLVPLVDVSFGMGAGAGVDDKKQKGTGGLGGKMTPCAVLVIKNGIVKLVNIKQQDTMTKILDMVPELVDKFVPSGKKEDKEINDAIDEAVEKNTKKF